MTRKLTRYNVWGLETAPHEQGPYVLYDDVRAECRKLGYESIEELGDGYMAIYNQLAAVREAVEAARAELLPIANLRSARAALRILQHALSQGEEHAPDCITRVDRECGICDCSQGEEEGGRDGALLPHTKL